MKLHVIDLDKAIYLEPVIEACDILKSLSKAYKELNKVFKELIAMADVISDTNVEVFSMKSTFSSDVIKAAAIIMKHYEGEATIDELIKKTENRVPITLNIVEQASNFLKKLVKTTIILKSRYDVCIAFSKYEPREI